MAFDNTRFTLMCFPQGVDATGLLSVNIVFLPRNISPLEKVSTIYGAGGKAEAFAKVNPQFEIKVVNDPGEFAGKVPANEKALPAILTYPSKIGELYKTLKEAKVPNPNVPGTFMPKYFDIDENRSVGMPGAKRLPPAMEKATAVKKYLPLSYQKSFNFTSPRIRNAVTDDSYHCAMRDGKPQPGFVPDHKVSWGKVYAHLLRQPLMAMAGGLLYKTTVQLSTGDFEAGGWLYVDVKGGTPYAAEQATSVAGAGDHFIKRYAAKIPPLKSGEAHSLFAPVLFPVMEAGMNPTGIYDELFMEAARFGDGLATIVHANQPVSQNLLQEEQDGIHPQKEIGIRLGWEDEQILVWYLRQLAKDDSAGGDRLDAPLGVMGYHIDVRKSGDTSWDSLTAVESNGDLMLESINIGKYKGELPFQVYPSKPYGGSQYWLPMYFANWNDTSLVQPDGISADIYQNDKDINKPVKASKAYNEVKAATKLRYGNTYEFRVRFSDISGGGPSSKLPDPANALPGYTAKPDFKRYVAPNAVRIVNTILAPHPVTGMIPASTTVDNILLNTDDANFNGASFRLKRPNLGYPAVVYTGKYNEADAIARLKAASVAATAAGATGEAFGIADPDVAKVEIHVEVETLQMDNLASDDGREHYITLYKTFREFDKINFDAVLDVPVTYADYPVLKLTDTVNPFTGDAAANATIAATDGAITIPTCRNIRLTFRAVCEGADSYWGHTNINPDLDARYGKRTTVKLRRESANEQNLFTGTDDAGALQGIYLQPDPVMIKLDPVRFKKLQGANEGMPNIVQRLGSRLDIAVKELTLLAENGERIQFWCSNLLRHSLSPDGSSITFANRNELQGHWLVCTSIYLDRDWTWDGLDTSSLLINRRRRWGSDDKSIDEKIPQQIGDVEIKRTASFSAIQAGSDGLVHREYTRIIIIDVIDSKPAGNDIPDTIEVKYTLKPQFRDGHNPVDDGKLDTEALLLPTTFNPVQMPKLIGAGVALSPYNRNEKYSATEPRKRFLWLEFDKAPDDPHDGLFARVLAYAPDQLLSNNDPSLMAIPDEPPLPVDPEYIRTMIPESSHEHSGLSAMQLMEKSVDEGRHFYLLPLPPGLHGESAELFGFFTYEFRYGHTDKIWSTAQGRFGRPLRVTGLQHPAPNIFAMVDRSTSEISVSAPFAQAVFSGRNVTSRPPRTAIWCLLYAQVRQADGLDYRNILLDDRELRMGHRKIRETNSDHMMSRAEVNQLIAIQKESPLYGHCSWDNADVSEMLSLYGLPDDSALSVICVEVCGTVTNMYDQFGKVDKQLFRDLYRSLSSDYNPAVAGAVIANMRSDNPPKKSVPTAPLNENLGQYRILRTSPLTEVPFVCCTD